MDRYCVRARASMLMPGPPNRLPISLATSRHELDVKLLKELKARREESDIMRPRPPPSSHELV